MSKPQKDDFEAVRMVIEALNGFEASDQERIIRWAREKLGIASPAHVQHAPGTPLIPSTPPGSPVQPSTGGDGATDIKSFVQAKAPTSDNQFVAVVAYYFRFQAPPEARKETVNGDDVLQACRLTGWQRPKRISQTMVNAHQQGLIDRAEGRGNYAINTVGENLVALTLPSGSAAGGSSTGPRRANRGRATTKTSKAAGKPKPKAARTVAKNATKKGRKPR